MYVCVRTHVFACIWRAEDSLWWCSAGAILSRAHPPPPARASLYGLGCPGLYYVEGAGLELEVIFLPLPPERCGYRLVSPLLALKSPGTVQGSCVVLGVEVREARLGSHRKVVAGWCFCYVDPALCSRQQDCDLLSCLVPRQGSRERGFCSPAPSVFLLR